MSWKTWMFVLLMVAVTMLAGFYAISAPSEVVIEFRWGAPTTGTTAVSYVGELDIDGVYTLIPGIPDTTFTLPWVEGADVRLRVAGVDVRNRQGLWSNWSATFHDDGPPGEPSQVLGTVVIR